MRYLPCFLILIRGARYFDIVYKCLVHETGEIKLKKHDAINFLRKHRESNQRKSADVLDMKELIVSKLNSLGGEKYIVLEQLINAALDYHLYNLAKEWITMLANDFPGSMRVMRYQANLFEAAEKYDKALEIYDNIIKADETNSMARKRRIAIFKAQGLTAETIKELVDYLKKFMSDMEAWQELSELYLQTQDYSKAAFCTEEMILHQPHNHLFHQRLADIRYTMGGIENMELAKTYYCQALKLNPDNMRALLGLFLTTNNLLSYHKTSGGKRKELWKLSQWTQAQISRKQRERCDSPVLHEMMVTLAINESRYFSNVSIAEMMRDENDSIDHEKTEYSLSESETESSRDDVN